MGIITTPHVTPDAHVNVGDAAVMREQGVLASLGLGSCVALMLYDRATRIGALAHILLPHEALSRNPGKPSKYASTAVAHLLELMRAIERVHAPEARVVGGASMFATLLNGAASTWESGTWSPRAARWWPPGFRSSPRTWAVTSGVASTSTSPRVRCA